MSTPQTGGSLLDRAVIVRLSFARPGNRKTVATKSVVAVSDDTDVSMLHVAKHLLDSPEFKAIAHEDAETKKALFVFTLPCQSLLGKGNYFIANEYVVPADQLLVQRKAARDLLIAAIPTWYDRRKEEARQKLTPLGLYNAADYPPLAEFQAAFDMTWTYPSFGLPTTLATISQDIFQREAGGIRAKLTEATDVATEALTLSFRKLLEKLVERLEPEPSGKPKIFRDTLIGNIAEFFESFPMKNAIIRSADLEQIVAKARQVLDGVDPQLLRDSREMRDYVGGELAEIGQTLDTMVSTKGRRLPTMSSAA